MLRVSCCTLVLLLEKALFDGFPPENPTKNAGVSEPFFQGNLFAWMPKSPAISNHFDWKSLRFEIAALSGVIRANRFA